MPRRRLSTAALAIWVLLVAAGIYVYIARGERVRDELLVLSSSSAALAAGLYLVLGCVRGLTLVPVTYLIPLGLLFMTPAVHFGLTMAGILASSASIYYLSDRVGVAEYFQTRHRRHSERLRTLLRGNELAIVIGWSFFPFVPTDLICYACGSLRVDLWKLLAGVFIGEGVICAVYIFLGRRLLDAF